MTLHGVAPPGCSQEDVSPSHPAPLLCFFPSIIYVIYGRNGAISPQASLLAQHLLAQGRGGGLSLPAQKITEAEQGVETFALTDACTFGSFSWASFSLFFSQLHSSQNAAEVTRRVPALQGLSSPQALEKSRRAPSLPAGCLLSRRAAADVPFAPRDGCWGPSERARISNVHDEGGGVGSTACPDVTLLRGVSSGAPGQFCFGLFFFFSPLFHRLPVTTRTFHKPPRSPSSPHRLTPFCPRRGDVQLPMSRSRPLPPARLSAAVTPRRGNPGGGDNGGLNATKRTFSSLLY